MIFIFIITEEDKWKIQNIINYYSKLGNVVLFLDFEDDLMEYENVEFMSISNIVGTSSKVNYRFDYTINYALSFYKTQYDYLCFCGNDLYIKSQQPLNSYLNKQNLIFHKKDYTSIYDFGSIIYSKTDAFLERANIASQGEITDQIWLEN